MLIKSDSQTERLCPVCFQKNYFLFSEENIDLKKFNDFTYSSRKKPEFMCFRLVRCINCDLIYTPFPPDINFLTNAYSNASYDSGEEANYAAFSYGKSLEKLISNFSKKNAALDVGAGNGAFLPWLVSQGFSPVLGIEPSDAAIRSAPLNIQPMLYKGMFSGSMISHLELSFISSFMTLEHISDPYKFIKIAYDSLSPGGILTVVTHNWRAPLNRILGKRSPIIDIEHLQLFSPRSIKILFESIGFENIVIKKITNIYPLKYWIRLSPFPSFSKNLILNLINNYNAINIRIPLRVGNILTIALKPNIKE